MSLRTLNAYDHYGYALVAMAGTALAVAGIVWLLRRSPWRDRLGTWRGVAPPFINILGVLFGLTLAFIANDTWSAHDKATSAVHREADALRSLIVLADGLEEPARRELLDALAAVGRSSVDEWASLAQRTASPQASERGDALLALLAGPKVTAAAGHTLQTLMLERVLRLREDRNLRIALSQTHLNPLKWLGMAFLGFLTLLSIAAVHVDNPRAAYVAIVLFALSAAPTAAIVLIQGNPFQPPSFVSPAPIEAALGALR